MKLFENRKANLIIRLQYEVIVIKLPIFTHSFGNIIKEVEST